MKTSKMLDGYPQRSCAAATLPPFARLPPLRAALPRRYADPRSASRRSGAGRPAVTPSASTAGLRVELARWRSLASASGVALGVKIGGVLRGVLPRSSALRASGGGARGDAVRGSPPRAQPRLRSALRLRLRLRASFKSAETADFQRRLSVRAFSAHFSALSGAPGPKNGPPRPHFTKKRPQKALQGRLQLAPSLFAARKTRGHLLNGGLPARRGLWTAPGTVPTAQTRSGLGSRPLGAPRHDLSIL